ncbi:MAG: hypothetical protein Q7S89_02095 [bacterium]|nr:hypothetical protein [bacterium]
MLQIWIPHLKKMSVAEAHGLGIFGYPAFDPADPPLARGWDLHAKELARELFVKFGQPAVIFTSPKRRCLQTAASAIELNVKPKDPKAPIAVSLSCLAQTDSGDHAPSDSRAEKDGLVYYGERSGPADWVRWFDQSREVIRRLRVVDAPRDQTVWVFTHRPLVAAARWATKHHMFDMRNQGGLDDLNALDATLLPYCIFDEDQHGIWVEIPRT